MSRGIHVFGSASMGALRAAELEAFGMEGIGIIFGWYCDGVLENDDEVAVVHGPSATGYQLGSDAMVNIRQTLRKAEILEVISTESRISLEKIGKELFYPDRNYSVLLRSAADGGLPEAELMRLRMPSTSTSQRACIYKSRSSARLMVSAVAIAFLAGLSRGRRSQLGGIFALGQRSRWQHGWP